MNKGGRPATGTVRLFRDADGPRWHARWTDQNGERTQFKPLPANIAADDMATAKWYAKQLATGLRRDGALPPIPDRMMPQEVRGLRRAAPVVQPKKLIDDDRARSPVQLVRWAPRQDADVAMAMRRVAAIVATLPHPIESLCDLLREMITDESEGACDPF
jgi:hypothetical protein